MRSCGGEPVVMWRSEAPFSTIALRSWCRFGTVVSLANGVGSGVAHHFLDGGHADLELRDARHAQRLHAEANGLALQFRRGGAVDDQLLEAVPHGHDLVERDAALVPALVAGAAALRLVDLEGSDVLGLDADVGERLGRHVDRLLALLAELAGETLGEDEVDGARHEERLDAHVEEAGDGSRSVIGVERREHQVARQSGLDADFRRFEVSDLADHDDVGVLAEEAAEGGGEVEADVLVHLHLVDAGEVEFDRIFGGGDVVARLVQLGERRVERSGLAGTGGAGDEHHAVGPVDGVLERLERLGIETELGHVELQVALVEESHDDLLAEERRADGDAEVHLASLAELELDAAVLREAALGDVQLGHDLQTAGDGRLQLHGRLHRLEEHAVHAVADAEVLLVGLDVDVGGALLDGVEEDEVHELDDRRVGGALLEVDDVLVVVVVVDLDLALFEPLHHLVVRGGLVGVVALQGLLDGLLGGDNDFDVVAGEELDVVDGVDVRRVAHRQDEGVARAVHRNALVLLGHVPGDELHHLRVDVEFLQVDRRNAVLLREEAGELRLLDEAELGQVVADAAASLLLLFLCLLKLLKRNQVFAYEQLTKPTGHPDHLSVGTPQV